MRKLKFISINIVLVLGMLLASCAPKATPTKESHAAAPTKEAVEEPTKEAVEEPTEAAVPEEKEPVVLHFLKMSDELEAKAFAEMVEEFHTIENGKWSYVTVEYDGKPFPELFPSIEKAVATGSDVDIVQADGPDVKHFAYNGVLMDLTDYFSEDEMKQWAPQSVVEGSMNGHFYGPPEVQSCQLMWFNKDMFDAAGIDYSNPDGWTYGADGTGLPNWQKLTKDEDGDGTPEVFGLETEGPWDYFQHIPARSNGEPGSPTYEGVGEDGISFVGYFDTPEAIEAYQFMQDMVYEYKVMSAEFLPNQMLSGLAATSVYQDMIVGTQKDQFPDFNMGGMEPPYFKTPLCQTGSWHYGITSSTKHFEEALAFVKFASSDAGAKYIWKYKNQLPANVNLYNTIDEFSDPANPRSLMANFFVQYGAPRIVTPGYTEYNALFTQFWTSLMAGEEDVAGLTHEYAQLMEEATAKYAGWQDK
ncbi:MAG: extracellular solute-binding protein [Anaerolineales bacterium]|nr:extracellular solute-binding protein [Anaerolineales bacterium]